MAKIRQVKVPSFVKTFFKQSGIKVKTFTSVASFEKVLLKFLKRNNVFHLCTSKNDMPRATPLEFRRDGFTFYVLSEGGEKFNNLKVNKNVSFSIAAPYDSNKDFWGAKGLQAWGKAKVYSMKDNPRRFKDAFKKIKAAATMKSAGMKELPPQFNYRFIEIIPDRINYGNLKEGVYHITWMRK